MRTTLAWLSLGIAGCNAITPIDVSPAPINTCIDAADCAGFPADAGVGCFTVGGGPGACQTAALGPYVLVVTVPSLAPVSAGATFALQSDTLFTTKTEMGGNACTSSTATTSACFRLPQLITAEGAYVVTQAQAETAGQPVNVPGVAYDVTLPVAATFWPQWPVGGSRTDARYLNLPLPPVTALVGGNASSGGLDLAAYPPAFVPDAGAPPMPIEWVVGLPPMPESSAYEGMIEITPPFNAGFPDVQYTVPGTPSMTIVTAQLGTLDHLFEEPTLGLTLNRSDGEALGDGWTVYLRDHSTHSALSSHATLTNGQTNVRLDAFANPAETNFDIVVDPPRGSVQPEFVDSQLQSPLIPRLQIDPATYPTLPRTVHVSGTVKSSRGAAVSSRLLFYSSSIDSQASCTGGSPPTGLFYETVVATDDQLASGGRVGEFSVDLPHGSYEVVIDPSPASGYAKSIGSRLRAGAVGDGCSGSSLSMSDTALVAQDPITVTGHVVTADGRAVSNATIEFAPSVAFAPLLNPALAPLFPFSSLTVGDRAPRPFSTTTGAEGTFSVQIDPHWGADPHYDVTVVPQPGTGFPWVVRPDHIYFDGQSVDIVVPAPSFMSLTLEDSGGNLLTNAIVQAYAFTSVPVADPANSQVQIASPVAVQIGQALTDAEGHFSMMLTTAFAP